MNSTIDPDMLILFIGSIQNISREMLLLTNSTNTTIDIFNKQFEIFLNNKSDYNNNIDNSDNRMNQRDPTTVLIPITVCYVIIFIVGLLGNVITCVVISRNKCMHTATNYYLFNLAISDLLLLVSGLPPEIYNNWYPTSYPFNQSFCVLHGLLSETSANGTVLTITSFTVERYIAICHPFRQHTMSKLSRAIKFIMAIWIIAFCLAIPQALQFGIVRNHKDDITLCTIVKDGYFKHAFEVSGFVFFVGPMTVICVLYVLIGLKLRKSKLLQGIKRKGCEFGRTVSGQTRVIRMLVAVVVAFFLCWCPFHLQRLVAVYGAESSESSELFEIIYKALTYMSGILYYLSTCINPLLYNIMSHKFRDAFKSTISQHCGFQDKYQQQNSNHTYSALSRYGGSLKLATTMNRINVHQEQTNDKKGNAEISMLQPSKNNIVRNGVKQNNLNQTRPRCHSVSSQTTLFTSLSNSTNNRENIIENNTFPITSNGIMNDKTSTINNDIKSKALITIAEKLRKSTKKVLQFKSVGVPNGTNSTKDDKLQKGNSVDSTHTNTISNSSLQELDEDEFTSTELARYMGEVNNEIRLDRNL